MTWRAPRRHFPRSLAEAFADVRAPAIELPPPRRLERVADVIAAVVIGLVLGLLAVQWWTA